MEKITIFLNGDYGKNIDYLKLCDGRRIICADGGTNMAYTLGLIPEIIIGDLDSIKKEVLAYYTNLGIKTIKSIREKDYTDFEMCLCYINGTKILDYTTRFKDLKIIEKDVYSNLEKYDILILGGLGGRIDMCLSNLKKAHGFSNIKFISSQNELCYWTNKSENFFNLKGQTVSIIPITNIKKLSLIGFKYSLKDMDISKDVGLCSNVFDENRASINFDEGEMYIVYDRK